MLRNRRMGVVIGLCHTFPVILLGLAPLYVGQTCTPWHTDAVRHAVGAVPYARTGVHVICSANHAGVSGFFVTIVFPREDFLKTTSYNVPWISSTKAANLTFGIIDSFAAMFQDTSEG
jgi:hypothetical protein